MGTIYRVLCGLLLCGIGGPTLAAERRPIAVAVLAPTDAGLEALLGAAAERLRAHGVSLRSVAVRAQALALSRQLLRVLPRIYARSAFRECTAAASKHERLLAEQLLPHQELGLALLKQLNQWIGLCRAAGGDRLGALEAFTLAARLPGTEPHTTHFSPEMRGLYQRAARKPTQHCRVTTPTGATALTIDGHALSASVRVALGSHYAAWRTGATAHSARITLGPDCRLTLPAPTPFDPRIIPVKQWRHLTGDDRFIADIARASGGSWLLILELADAQLRLRLLDARRKGLDLRATSRLDPSRSTVSLLVEQVERLLQTPTTRPAHPAAQTAPASLASDRPRRWYRRWWVWVAAGAVVAGAIAVPVALSAGDDEQRYDIEF